MIYLDANASAKLRPSVVEFLKSCPQFYNASSVHSEGRKARAALREARLSILKLVNAPEAELVFTSGGTEACNLMLYGLLGEVTNCNIVTSSIEHPAVKEAFKKLNKVKIIEVQPSENGRIDPGEIYKAVDKNTALVNLMLVNNESGVIQALDETINLLRKNNYSGLIVSDATQALAKLNFNLTNLFELGLDAIAVSGHKIGAPAGIGAMLYNSKSKYCRLFDPQIVGGPQEKGFRAGTENLLGAICFGLAANDVDIYQETKYKAELSDYLLSLLNSKIKGIRRYGEVEHNIGNTLLLGFEGCLAGDLVAALDIEGVAISTGAACASGKQSISDTVKALEPDKDKANEVVRISLDWSTTRKDIENAADIFGICINRMRAA